MRHRLTSFLWAALVFTSPALHAQTAAEYIQLGDKAYAARNAAEALKQYDAALGIAPQDVEALWKSAREGVDLAEFEGSADQRHSLYNTAEQRAKLAVQLAPNNADTHFTLARVLGRIALSLGVRDRIRYGTDVHDQAVTCLKLDPKHPGCLHVLGVWNAEIMRLNSFSRMIAKTFLGGRVFNEASWANARKYLESSVTIDPRRIVHRLDLGRVYADMGMKDKARTQFESVINGELIDYNDPQYKSEAQRALQKL